MYVVVHMFPSLLLWGRSQVYYFLYWFAQTAPKQIRQQRLRGSCSNIYNVHSGLFGRKEKLSSVQNQSENYLFVHNLSHGFTLDVEMSQRTCLPLKQMNWLQEEWLSLEMRMLRRNMSKIYWKKTVLWSIIWSKIAKQIFTFVDQ